MNIKELLDHVDPNLYEFSSSVENKKILQKMLVLVNQTIDGTQ